MANATFRKHFQQLTGFAPFPWQERLFALFVAGRFSECQTCSLPTGLGKTSLIVLWLLALAKNPSVVPRRLVYIVNRRTVVDQTTNEAVALRDALEKIPKLKKTLTDLVGIPALIADQSPLAISTLRGQFADNQEWSADPSRPAVVAGTVDMIGSRLLFNGYRSGFKSKPLQAGFLGTDVLLIHDEAHLEPAFQSLLQSIEAEQTNGRFPELDSSRRLKVIELSATTRCGGNKVTSVFSLNEDDRENSEITKRINASKGIVFHQVSKENEVAEAISAAALRRAQSNSTTVIFVRKVDDVKKITAALTKARKQGSHENIAQLTGTIRGRERDRLATENSVFQRFLPPSNRNPDVEVAQGAVYLVATAAGEVGVNLSADHMVCDLSSYESMAQRLGRVNRFGKGDAEVDVIAIDAIVHGDADKLKPIERSIKRTFELFQELPVREDSRFDASPSSLGTLDADDCFAAFSPHPKTLRADEFLFDVWSQTTFTMPSLRDSLAGRPPVEEWLHGVEEFSVKQCQVAWRMEVDVVTDELLDAQVRAMSPEQCLEAFPLKPHELLKDSIDRVFDSLKSLSIHLHKNGADSNVWLVDSAGCIQQAALSQLVPFDVQANVAKRIKERLANQTILLPPSVGGLDENGMFVGVKGTSVSLDVSHELVSGSTNNKLRVRYFTDDVKIPSLNGYKTVLRFAMPTSESMGERTWVWCVRQPSLDDGSSSWTASKRQLLSEHQNSARYYARQFTMALGIDSGLASAVEIAAQYHDLGKRRALWQRGIGNDDFDSKSASSAWAKSGNFRPPLNASYRHEFGSLTDVEQQVAFKTQTESSRELILHLIASHHGRGRPHFPDTETFDPERTDDCSAEIAKAVPVRFANLQRTYGRWQLAWLESLVRAADYLASQTLVPADELNSVEVRS